MTETGSMQALLTAPERHENDGRLTLIHRGPLLYPELSSLGELNGLLNSSDEKVAAWIRGARGSQDNKAGVCLLLRRDSTPSNYSDLKAPPTIVEAAQEALLETQRLALQAIRAALPEHSCKIKTIGLEIGRRLVIEPRWHADANALTPGNELRFNTSPVGTRCLPDGVEVDITDRKVRWPSLVGTKLEPVSCDNGLTIFTNATIHRSPTTPEVEATLAVQQLIARPFINGSIVAL